MRAQINRKNRIKEHIIRTNVEGSIDRYELLAIRSKTDTVPLSPLVLLATGPR